jgi:hypothetical protein
MPAEYPYLQTVKKVPDYLEKVKAAQTPPRFTHEFLKSNLGFGSSTDRPFISILKKLGFLSSDGTPMSRYNEFRSENTSGRALATGLREGWSEVFLSNQKAHELSTTELKGIIKSVTGKGEKVAERMATTFKALAKHADWSADPGPGTAGASDPEENLIAVGTAQQTRNDAKFALHSDVHVHLPATSDVAVYTAIFRALREEFID